MDESLQSGDDSFEELTKNKLGRFYSKERTLDNVKYSGIIIKAVEGIFLPSPGNHYEKLNLLTKGCAITYFRSIRAKLA